MPSQLPVALRTRFRPDATSFARHVLLLFAVAIGTTACARTEREIAPTRLRIGVLPDQSADQLRQEYQPLVAYLAQATGLPGELVVPQTYQQLLDDFAEGKFELAFFGGVTFVLASERVGASPLVLRTIDRQFTTAFLASAKDSRRTLEEFRGARFTFGAALSTSGHVMARQFLEQQGIDAERHFGSVGYSGGHDRTAFLVRDRQQDLGAANAVVIEQMFQRGELRREDMRVVAESPPFVDYVWAVPRSLPATLRVRLTDAFLALTPDDSVGGDILTRVGASGFLPASVEDFREMAVIVRRLQASPIGREFPR